MHGIPVAGDGIQCIPRGVERVRPIAVACLTAFAVGYDQIDVFEYAKVFRNRLAAHPGVDR
jgi:hypothetical protein